MSENVKFMAETILFLTKFDFYSVVITYSRFNFYENFRTRSNSES